MYLSLSAQRGSLLNLEGANREESTGAHPPELTFRGSSQKHPCWNQIYLPRVCRDTHQR
jgi:hypothetical protein